MSTEQNIKELTLLLKTLIENIDKTSKKSSRLEELTEEINKTPELQHLFIDDEETSYYITKTMHSKKFNHLQKCVILTSKFKFLEEYIDLYLKKYPETIDYQNERKWTALMIASMNSNNTSTEKTVEILLKHKANVDLLNEYKCTALMYAARNSKTYSTEKTVEMLLKHGADPNIQDKTNSTALMYASRHCRTTSSEKTIELLINHNANINLKNEFGETALILASAHSKTDSTEEAVELLLKNGADPNLLTVNGQTALMLSAPSSSIKNTEKTIELLLKYNANASIRDNDGDTALALSIYYYDDSTLGTIKMLLDKTDNCDYTVCKKKLIKYMWEANLPEEILDLAIQKGAKVTDLCDEKLAKLMAKYLK